MAPANKHYVGVSVRVRPSQNGEHDAAVVQRLRAEPWVRGWCVGSDQAAVYDSLGAELVTRLRNGYNCALLAYGQTGSGKTYTMFGPSGCLTESALAEAGEAGGDGVPAPWGVFPRVALELLRSCEGTLHASAVEVYNNVAYDLLDDKRQLQLSASRKSEVAAVFGGAPEGEGTRVAGLNGKHPPACSCRLCFRAQEQAKAAKAAKRRAGGVGSPVSTSAVLPGRSKQTQAEVDRSSAPSSSSFATVGETLWALDCDRDVAKLARHVEASRSAGSHQLNARSSRSHCLVRLHVDSGGGGGGGGVLLQRQFWFVDLAGSERTQKSGVSGQRLSEATQINNSLTVLGRVIRGLGGKGGGRVLPYRDSTLTMLLRSCFEPVASDGGKVSGCFSSVVVNVASEPEHAEETSCSLRFGQRMTAVASVASKVQGTDVAQERERVLCAIEAVRGKLSSMQAAGAGGGYVEGHRSTERSLLEQNLEKQTAARLRCEQLRVQAAEASDGDRRAQIERRLAEAQMYEQSVTCVVYAQKTIKRLWKEPSAAYVGSQAELKSLTERLARLGG